MCKKQLHQLLQLRFTFRKAKLQKYLKNIEKKPTGEEDQQCLLSGV
jgi:hypothetical protein